MSQLVLDCLREKFAGSILETHSQHGDETAVVRPEQWKSIGEFLRNDSRLQMDLLVDLCGVDHLNLDASKNRIDVVMHLASIARRHRVRIKARVGNADGEGAEIDSVTSIWPGANWLERETYDMFGVIFRGHPDLRRILMYPEFEGFPLRKDYPAQKTQPLVEYRTVDEAGVPLDKLSPFLQDEGMSFGRNVFDADRDDPHEITNPPDTGAV